jgi:protease I
MDSLKKKRVAILVDNGFEEDEMTEPRKALEEAGAETCLISPQPTEVRAWHMKNWGESYPVQRQLDEAEARDFDALLLPGGVRNPDHLRMQPKAVEFVKAFFDANKPVAAICHGPWTIVEAGKARGRKITSWPSLKTDLRNAGAEWVDQEVVVDGNLVSSRNPDDIPAFNREMLRVFSHAAGKTQAASKA